MFSEQVTDLLKRGYSFFCYFEENMKKYHDYYLYHLTMSNKFGGCNMSIAFIHNNVIIQIYMCNNDIKYNIIHQYCVPSPDKSKDEEMISKFKEVTNVFCENMKSNIILDELKNYKGYIDIDFSLYRTVLINVNHIETYDDKYSKTFKMTRKEANFYLLT